MIAPLLKGFQYLCIGLVTVLVLCAATLLGLLVAGIVYVAQFIAIGLAVVVGVAYAIWEAATSKPKR